MNASGLWPGKVVTELAPAGPFWEAEPEHQDYLVKHPNGYTCHYPCGLEAAATRDRLTANAQERWGSARQWRADPVSVFPEEMVMQSRCIQQAPELRVPWWIDGEGAQHGTAEAVRSGRRVQSDLLLPALVSGCHSHGFPTLRS